MKKTTRPGRPSKFQLMERTKPLIIKDIKKHALKSNKRVFSKTEVADILYTYQYKWMLPRTTGLSEFLGFLIDNNILTDVEIEVPYGSKLLKKHTLGEVFEYEIALSIKPNSYLSHYSAIYLNGLTDNIPQVIYINKEQGVKPKYSNDLSQDNIDRAFARPMRRTNQIAKFDNYKVYLLNGKHTDDLGVTDYDYGQITIPITNLERTLIDAVVRPDYAGGIEEVLNAFVAAKGKISVNKLVATLKKIDYIYPYHQAVGFYLEKAGYKENVLKLVEELGAEYNFYLTYEMKDKAFNNRWKLYVPRRF